MTGRLLPLFTLNCQVLSRCKYQKVSVSHNNTTISDELLKRQNVCENFFPIISSVNRGILFISSILIKHLLCVGRQCENVLVPVCCSTLYIYVLEPSPKPPGSLILTWKLGLTPSLSYTAAEKWGDACASALQTRGGHRDETRTTLGFA